MSSPTVDEQARLLPPSSSSGVHEPPPPGVSCLVTVDGDASPDNHHRAEHEGDDAFANNTSDDSDAEFDPTAAAYGVERSRYVVLFTLCLVNGVNALLWMTYATIVTPTETFYGINSSDINTLNITYMAIYAGAFWLSGIILPKTGLGWGLVLGGLMNVTTCVLRLVTVWMGSPSYGMILAGNLVGGFCQVLVLSAPPMCSNQWFALEERNFATGMGVAAQVFGGALGALFPSNIVTDGTAKQFEVLYCIQMGLSAVGFLGALLAKKAPTMPPTAAAFKLDENVTRRSFRHERIGSRLSGGGSPHSGRSPNVRRSQGGFPNAVAHTTLNSGNVGHLSVNNSGNANVSQRSFRSNKSTRTDGGSLSTAARARRYIRRAAKDILTTLKAIATNVPFLLILLICGLVQGSLWAAGTLLMQIVQPFDVAQTTVGWLAFAGQIAGGLSSVGIGGILAFFPNYKPVLLILILGLTVFTLIFPIVAIAVGDGISVGLSTGLAALLYIGLCIFGVAQVPLLFELGVEVTFPLSEEVTSPLIMWTPSVFSLILVQALGYLLTDNPTQDRAIYSLFILGGLMAVSLAAGFGLKLQYKRREYETKQLQQQQQQK